MAYCKNCGAYIPDGQTVCLACGYQERPQQAAAAAAAPKKEPQRDDDLNEVMDRHRQLQKEKSMQWAKQEKERRDRERENRRWAQEEYMRRQAERELKEEERRREAEEKAKAREVLRTDREQASGSGTQSYGGGVRSQSGNTALAALSYLSVLFLLPFLAAPNDDFAMFHAKQGLRLFIFCALADLIGAIFPIAWVFSLARIYFIIKGIGAAINGRKEPLPYIGTIGDI